MIGNYDWPAVNTDEPTSGSAPGSMPPPRPRRSSPCRTGRPTSLPATRPSCCPPNATVTDPDSPDFATGTLTVSFVTNGTVDDLLGIRNEGSAGGQIGVLPGNLITFGGTTIGTFAAGNNGFPLTIALNASATSPPPRPWSAI